MMIMTTTESQAMAQNGKAEKDKTKREHANPMLQVGAKVGNIAAKLPGGLIGETVDSIDYYTKQLNNE